MSEGVPSHRPLRDSDGALTQLGRAERELVARAWQARAVNELRTSTTFAEVYRALVALGAPDELLVLAARAIEDERRHSAICRHVAARYAERAVEAPRVQATEPPHFAGCSARETRVLFVVSHTCLNEGIATAYLQACLADARSALAHDAVRDLLEDEIQHARLGWAFLGWAPPSDRRLVAEALPALLEAIERLWLADPEQLEVPRGHGVLGAAALAAVVTEARAELLLPGFEHLGVNVAGLQAQGER